MRARGQGAPGLPALLLLTGVLIGADMRFGIEAAGPGFTPDGNLERKQVPDRYKWNLAPLFTDEAASDRGLAEQAEKRTRLKTFAGRLGDPKTLADSLDLYFETRLLTNRLSLYGNLRRVTDEAAPDGQRLRDRGLAALNDLMTDAGFIRIEVIGLSDAAMTAAYAKEPRLGAYRPYLDEFRRRKSRVLGAEAERVLALSGDNLWAEIDLNEIPSDFEKAYDGIRNGLALPVIKDAENRPVQLNLSNYGRYRSSIDRRVRREAVE